MLLRMLMKKELLFWEGIFLNANKTDKELEEIIIFLLQNFNDEFVGWHPVSFAVLEASVLKYLGYYWEFLYETIISSSSVKSFIFKLNIPFWYGSIASMHSASISVDFISHKHSYSTSICIRLNLVKVVFDANL